MKRILADAAKVCAPTVVILLAHIAPGAADGRAYRHHYRHHPHLGYVEYVPAYSNCSTGWWQTLRYGHVRPQWGTWCR